MLALLTLIPALRPGRLTLGKTKQLLSRFDVVIPTSVFEADELRALLRSELPGVAEATGHAVPLEYMAAAADALGPGATVDSKSYCAVRLELPEVASPEAASTVRFVLDTAASNSLVTPEASAALGARPTGVTASASTATSPDGSGFQQVNLGEARLPGGLSLGSLAPVAMPLPLPGRAGLLGLDVLERFAIELVLRPGRPFAVLQHGQTRRPVSSGASPTARGPLCVRACCCLLGSRAESRPLEPLSAALGPRRRQVKLAASLRRAILLRCAIAPRLPPQVLHPAGQLPAEARAGMRLLPTRRLPGSGLLVTRAALGAEAAAPRGEVDAARFQLALLHLGSVGRCRMGLQPWECVGLRLPTRRVAASDTHGRRWTRCSISAPR